MEINEKEAKDLDIILENVTKKDHTHQSNISTDLFPNEDESYVANLLEILKDYYPPIVDVTKSKSTERFIVCPKDNAKHFLNTGGFYKLYKDAEGKIKKEKRATWNKQYKAPLIVGAILALFGTGLVLLQNQLSAQKDEQKDNHNGGQIQQMNQIDSATVKDTTTVLPTATNQTKSDTTKR